MEGSNTNPVLMSLQPPVLLPYTAKLFWVKNNGIHNFFQQLLLEESTCVQRGGSRSGEVHRETLAFKEVVNPFV